MRIRRIRPTSAVPRAADRRRSRRFGTVTSAVVATAAAMAIAAPASAAPPPPPPPPPPGATAGGPPVSSSQPGTTTGEAGLDSTNTGDTESQRPATRPRAGREPGRSQVDPRASRPTRTPSDSGEESLEAIKSSGATMIAERLEALDRADAAIGDAEGPTRNLTDAHKAALTSIVDSTKEGLEQVGSQLQAATEISAARALKKSIVETYRVFMLRMPQVRLTSAADTIVVVAGKLDDAIAKARAALADAAATGVDTTKASTELDEAAAAADAARGSTAGIGDRILAIQPSQMPGANADLAGARTAIKDAMRQLRDAVKSVRNAVRSVDPDGEAGRGEGADSERSGNGRQRDRRSRQDNGGPQGRNGEGGPQGRNDNGNRGGSQGRSGPQGQEEPPSDAEAPAPPS